ncbi:MAG TPA: hypothetical protein VKE74_07300 [Gemmataceae bacterium]|nr:hypothetical protein [Gemmataceae bacterium]
MHPTPRRHLIYHLLPVAGNGVWRRVDALRRRWDLFDGIRVIAVMTGEGPQPPTPGAGRPHPVTLEEPGLVRDYLPAGAEVLELPNDHVHCEGVSWLPLWERVLAVAHDSDAVLFGHAKAVCRDCASSRAWADLIDVLYLDHWPETEVLLTRFPVAGSWFWARAGGVRERPWRDLTPHWSAVEMWPGLHYHPTEAGCLFLEASLDLDPHRPEAWDRVVRPEYDRWRAARPTGGAAPEGAEEEVKHRGA